MSVETILDHQPKGDAPVPQPSKGRLAAFKKTRAFLLGYDIFISYRRKDANAYALALANRLTKLGFRCYLDQFSAPANKEIPDEVLTALRNSTALVVIGTPGAVESKAVATEVGMFAASRRTIIPISVEGTLGDGSEAWGGGIKGLSQADETWDAVRERKRPSAGVLVRLTDSAKFRRRNKQLQRTFFSLLAGISVALAVGLVAALLLWRQVEAATLQAKSATDQATAADAKRVEADIAAGEARRAADDAKKLREEAETALGTARTELGRVGESLKVAQAGLKDAQTQAEAAQAEADEQTHRAQKQRRAAASQELATSATAQLPTDPEAGVLLARDALLADATPQARTALRRTLFASHIRRAFGADLQDSTVNATFDRSGEVAATVNADAVSVWQVETGQLLAKLNTGEQPQGGKASGEQVYRLFFSPDGQHLVGASHHDILYLWRWRDEKSRAKPLKLRGVQETPAGGVVKCSSFGCFITTVAFTRDGAHFAAAGHRGVISVWETATGKLVRHLSVHTAQVNEVRFSPDGRYLASSSDDGRLVLWEWNAKVGDGHPRNLSQSPPGLFLLGSLSFDESSRFLVVAANSPRNGAEIFQAEVYEVKTGARRAVLAGHSEDINQVSFSRRGQYVLTASDDGTARLWNWADLKEWSAPVILRGHDGAVLTAALSPDGRLAVTGGDDDTARVWHSGLGLKPSEVPAGNKKTRLISKTEWPLAAMWGHRSGVREARFSADGRRVLTIGYDNAARVWEPNTERVRAILRGHGDSVWSADFSPDGKHVVTTGERGDALHVWPVGDGGQVGEPLVLSTGREMNFRKPYFSPDGRYIVAVNNGYDNLGPQEVYVWDWRGASGAAPVKLDLGRGYLHLAKFSHDREGRYVAVASGSDLGIQTMPASGRSLEEQTKLNLVRVWDWRAPLGPHNPVVIGPFKSPVQTAIFSYDAESRYVATVSREGVRVFDWRADGAPEVTHLPTSATDTSYHDAAFSPDGRHLAVARVTSVEVWDWQNKEEHRRPMMIRGARGETLTFSSVAFSPDGELLVTSDVRGGVRVWDVRTGVLFSIVGKRSAMGPYLLEATVSFGPDGTSILAAAGEDARIYECPECAGDERLLALVSRRVTPQQLLTGHSPLLLDLEKDEGSATTSEGRSRRRHHQLFRGRD